MWVASGAENPISSKMAGKFGNAGKFPVFDIMLKIGSFALG